MEKQNILSRMVIREMQAYLATMDWTHGRADEEKNLCTFLRGVSYALWDKGIYFKLRETYDPYRMFYVEVWQYKDANSEWSGSNLLFGVYADHLKAGRSDTDGEASR